MVKWESKFSCRLTGAHLPDASPWGRGRGGVQFTDCSLLLAVCGLLWPGICTLRGPVASPDCEVVDDTSECGCTLPGRWVANTCGEGTGAPIRNAQPRSRIVAKHRRINWRNPDGIRFRQDSSTLDDYSSLLVATVTAAP